MAGGDPGLQAPGASWACVATTTAPRRAVEWFAAHHLDRGAREVVVFFDDPQDATALILQDVPGLRVVECDAVHWRLRGQGRPGNPRQRAVFNANHAATALCDTDWIVALDIDQFLCGDPGAALATLPGDTPAARIAGTDRHALRCRTRAARFAMGGVRLHDGSAAPAALPDDASQPPTGAQLAEAVARHVAPWRRPDARFSHMSETRATGVAPMRLFQVGMNRSGSKEICAHFGRRGHSYAHWANGRIARDLHRAVHKGVPPLGAYGAYDLISDIEVTAADLCYEGFHDVDHLARHFPQAVFILNHRPLADWIRSRSTFRGGRYIEAHRQYFGLSSYAAVQQKWAGDWADHCGRMDRLRSMGIRVIDWPIYTMHPAAFFDELARLTAG